YEFTACDQVADCTAALGGTRSPPPQAGPTSMTLIRVGGWRSRGATGGEPSPPLASAASRRVGPCTRSVVQRSCTGGPGAASASVTLGRRADSERSGPPPAPVSPSHANEQNVSLCYALGERSATSS